MTGAERVRAAMAELPRERFVTGPRAGDDVAVPIACGQTASQPSLVARMCELLELGGDELVLDVGTGSGWHAAVLARLARHVVSVERHPELSARAHAALRAAGVRNVTLVVGDGARGHAPLAPYDAINVAAASRDGVPPALTAQLADGGRLLLPVVDEDGVERLVLVRRQDRVLVQEALDPVRFVPLITERRRGA